MLNKLCIVALISVFMLAGCSYNEVKKKVSEITVEEQERLNSYLTQLDSCQLREINRLDDGVTNISEIAKLVEWKCKGHYNNIKMMLYEDFGVGLGHAYLFADKLVRASPNKILESIIAKRKMENPNDANMQLLKRNEGQDNTPQYDNYKELDLDNF